MRHLAFIVSFLVFAVLAFGDDAPSTTQTPLEGEWTMVGGEFNGKPLPERIIKSVGRVVIHGKDWIDYPSGAGEPDRFTIVTDEKASPKTIDRTDLDPAAGDKKLIVGIYKIEGDKLIICERRPGEKERPTEFRSDKSTMIREYRRKVAK
jgi:uncharacterized protein (TIGR03067 family)